jgi:hypothetical protein
MYDNPTPIMTFKYGLCIKLSMLNAVPVSDPIVVGGGV